MDKQSYKKFVKRLSPQEPRYKNALVSFLVGGSIGAICELLSYMIINSFGISKVDSYVWITLIIILVATFLTSLGWFDKYVEIVKCGFIIPTTGFAHSVTSCALDYKKDGMITGLGSNFFKLAGSVILYGILSSFFLVVLEVIFNG